MSTPVQRPDFGLQPEQQNAAPGWYPDPTYDDLERLWTGQNWTADIRPRAQLTSTRELDPGMLAGPGSRFLAWLLDSIIIDVLAALAAIPALTRIYRATVAWVSDHMAQGLAGPTSPTDLPAIAKTDVAWVGLAGFAICMLYYFLQLHCWGKTVGQRALSLRTASESDLGEKGLSWDQSGRRAMLWAILASISSLWAPAWAFQAFSSLLVFSHPRRQTWPDLFARTVVIRAQ